MLWSMARLRGYGLRARDGTIGSVVTLYFDDQAWTVRYLEVDTGGWLPGRHVLIAPHVLGDIDRDAREIRVHLSREQVRDSPEETGDAHPRSAKEVAGYEVHCLDHAIGHVEDVVIDDDGWHLRYFIIDTGTWLPGRKVALPPEWVRALDWDARRLELPLTAEAIQGGPDYTDERAIDRAYEERLYAHYGRPAYW